jgi:hypothetical protein
MGYGPDQQLAFPAEGQADWDSSLGANFTILTRGYHTLAQAGAAVSTGDILWMNSGGFYFQYDPRSTAIFPQAVAFTAAGSGDSMQALLRGVVRSVYPTNSVVPGFDYFVASGSPGIIITSLTGHPVTYSVGFGVAGGGLYFNPRKV